MDFRSRYGPWALITGASAGLGLAYARALAQRGLDLILVARRLDRLEEIADELRACSIQVRVLSLDLTAKDAPQAIAEEIATRPVGLFVNNAGFGFFGPFLEQSDASMRSMVRLNCEVPTLLSKLVLPQMAERGQGGMLLLASAAGYQPTPWMSAYGATKGYDLLLGEALAVEMSASNVDVLVVSPGHTRTEFHEIAGVTGAIAGGSATPESVVEESLAKLGRKISFVHGWHNSFLTWTSRLFPRSWVAKISGQLLRNR